MSQDQDKIKRKINILDDDVGDHEALADESKKVKISEESVKLNQNNKNNENEIVLLHDYSLLPQEILTLIFKYLSIKERCQMAR
jgi:hypothetical protein